MGQDVTDHDLEGDACEADCDGTGCPSKGSSTNRRHVLGAVATGSAISLSGCLGLYSFGSSPDTWRSQRQTAPRYETPPDEDGNGDENGDGDANGDDEEGEVHNVRYLKQDETIEVPSDQSLLVAGEEQGWNLPYQCRSGYCGECTARLWGEARELVEMDGNQFLTDEEIDDGFVLTCVGHAQDDFTLVTGERGALDR